MKYLSAVKKAIGALLGAAVGTQVDFITNLFGFDLTGEADAAIAVLLATLGAFLAGKNVPLDSEPAETPEAA